MKALTESIKAKAKTLGADLVGVCSVESMGLSEDGLKDLYPGAKSVVVFAYRHSSGALEASESMIKSGSLFKDSKYTRLNRYDVSHVYHSLDTMAHRLVRYIEEKGYASEAVSGWLPVDWGEGKRGLVADLDIRRAAVEAGLGTFGKNNLVITPEFGPRVRIGGVLTSAELVSDSKIEESLCIEGCNLCIECCPAKALKKGEKTDVQACGVQVFQFGLRSLIYYIRNQLKKPKEEVLNTFVDTTLMNLWQTLCLGIYYTCSECQRACPVGSWRKKLVGCSNPEM
jgi:epoxyqueuosine reductase